MNKLKVGFLVDGYKINFQKNEILEHIINSDLFESPVIFHVKKNVESKGKILRSLRLIFNKKYIIMVLLKLITFVEKFHAKKYYKKFFFDLSLKNYSSLKNIFISTEKTSSCVSTPSKF